MSFRPVGVVRTAPERCARNALVDDLRVFRADDGFEARITDRLVARALEIGRNAKPLEWFGLLLGRVLRDERGEHAVVDAIVVDPDADAGVSHVRTTAASEARTRAAARRDFPDLSVIGWIHGHLSHGARFSSVDIRNQASWRDEHALGVVVDPWSTPEIAVYRGPACELLAEVPAGRQSSAEAESTVRPREVRRPHRHPLVTAPIRRTDQLPSAFALATAITACGIASFALGRTTLAAPVVPRACIANNMPRPIGLGASAAAADAGLPTPALAEDRPHTPTDAGAELEDAAQRPRDAARPHSLRHRRDE